MEKASLHWIQGACLFWCLAALGCGGSGGGLVPVKGVVKVEGKPAAGAVVTFHLQDGGMNNSPATAIAGPDGSFSLTTGEAQGVKPGKYKVTVTWPDPSKKPSQKEIMMGASVYDGPDLLGGKYASSQKSPLEVEITSGTKEIAPFELTP